MSADTVVVLSMMGSRLLTTIGSETHITGMAFFWLFALLMLIGMAFERSRK